ncbi:hypothetical protein M408DRAFT_27540 [Serendipita vermifera MAFF 305830]|uniref:Uncharacterized protein n=1 Tax=Serendipita vermifera MAFF 305830 TaxID=933852 RepID=A0A0C3AGQ5_SERVB|nr:hypothetical protein M408DRAFT_27540 [Serendipita vermifera MAFF 305830]
MRGQIMGEFEEGARIAAIVLGAITGALLLMLLYGLVALQVSPHPTLLLCMHAFLSKAAQKILTTTYAGVDRTLGELILSNSIMEEGNLRLIVAFTFMIAVMILIIACLVVFNRLRAQKSDNAATAEKLRAREYRQAGLGIADVPARAKSSTTRI